MLYGFNEPPPLDIKISWTETHNTFIPANSHKARIDSHSLSLSLNSILSSLYNFQVEMHFLLQEWIYFLHKGSKIDISFNVKSLGSPPLLLIIATGNINLSPTFQLLNL